MPSYTIRKNNKNNNTGNTSISPTNNSDTLTGDLQTDLDTFKKIFFFPQNKDFVIRNIRLKGFDVDGCILYLDGSSSIHTLTEDIIRPLMEGSPENAENNPIDYIINNIITPKDAQRISKISDITKDIVKGNTILLIYNSTEALSVSTAEFEHRSVEKPVNENVIKGPKESFVESADVNRSLIRKYLKYENLISESIEVGEKSKNEVYIMYIKGIADPDLVNAVKEKIKSIRTDFLPNLSTLEQFIEDRSYSLISTVLYSERPDRAAAFLNEGHIILITDGSPACLIVPVTFWAFFHAAEDQYQRWWYGNFIRMIRLLAVVISWLTPALYIAVVNFHGEMIPTDLAVSIAASREVLPFPVITEILLMEVSFELIREAGVRVPTTIGPTIGIVGALILGQAAVEANIVSPILVIVVAITGLSSFAIPETTLSYTIRISRFILLLAGATMGFLGISFCIVIGLAYILSITSFVVPFMSPVAPHFPSTNDSYTRSVIFKQWLRPTNISKSDSIRRNPKRK
ncbi:MAG: spore germination protein GerA family [Defluviitaleaceae bacterium]|jgi:spore germination protein KA|nr:spore germination protein GerA family [Defluviitaleaceae bacterium]